MISTGNERNDRIIKLNLFGIIMSLILSFFMIAVGSWANSRVVVLDGVSGFADLLSMGISITSTALASKRADKAHPLGYGRLEYTSSLLVTMLIMYMGIRVVIKSVGNIINPESEAHYGNVKVIVLVMVVSLICKISYGLMMRKTGRELKSVSMIMTGADSMDDALDSGVILIGIVVMRVTGFNLEPYLCILLALHLIHTSIGMIRECMNKIVGQRIDAEFRRKIKQTLIAEDGVLNVCNLVVHSYGEGVLIGSVDIVVEGDMTAFELTKLTRRIIRKAAEQGLTLTSVGVCGSNLSDPRAAEMWDTILDMIRKYDDIIAAQQFSVDFEDKNMSFYVVQDYSKKTRDHGLNQLKAELESVFPEMTIDIYTGIDI